MRAGSTIRLAKRLRRRGTRPAGVAAVPHRPSGRPSGRSIRSPVAALGAPAGSRVAPPPGQRRSGQESLHDCGPYFGPHVPPAQRAFPTSESSCVRHGRRPTSAPAGFYALHGPKKPSAPTRQAVAAPTRVATAKKPFCPAGVCSKEVSPFGWAPSGTTGQTGLIATRTFPRISRFARRLGAGA